MWIIELNWSLTIIISLAVESVMYVNVFLYLFFGMTYSFIYLKVLIFKDYTSFLLMTYSPSLFLV